MAQLPYHLFGDGASFWAKADCSNENGCWPWIGQRDRAGYGKIFRGQRTFVASRVAWFLHHGEEAAEYVCHSCDNPRCVNPAHLWAGSAADNNRDCVRKGRQANRSKTHCRQGHEYSPANTYVCPLNRRYCRTCNRANVATYKLRKAAA